MSAGAVVQEALLGSLRAALAGAINGVFEGPAVKASPPYVELGEMLVSDWGTKDRAGRELRLVVTLRDRAEGSGRIQALADLAEAAIAGLPLDLPGWRVASVALIRTRILRTAPSAWGAAIEHRIRLLATGDE